VGDGSSKGLNAVEVCYGAAADFAGFYIQFWIG